MKESLQTLGFSGISYKSDRYEQAKSEVNKSSSAWAFGPVAEPR